MLAGAAAVMGTARHALRFVAEVFDVRTTNVLLHAIEVLVLLAQ